MMANRPRVCLQRYDLPFDLVLGGSSGLADAAQ
jgi:hypothetical protein